MDGKGTASAVQIASPKMQPVRAKHFADAKCAARNLQFFSWVEQRFSAAVAHASRIEGGMISVPRESSRILFRFAELIGRAMYHLARDARILEYRVAVGEAPPLLFLLFARKDNLLRGLKQIFDVFGHG
jgi:hypothetical protein